MASSYFNDLLDAFRRTARIGRVALRRDDAIFVGCPRIANVGFLLPKYCRDVLGRSLDVLTVISQFTRLAGVELTTIAGEAREEDSLQDLLLERLLFCLAPIERKKLS